MILDEILSSSISWAKLALLVVIPTSQKLYGAGNLINLRIKRSCGGINLEERLQTLLLEVRESILGIERAWLMDVLEVLYQATQGREIPHQLEVFLLSSNPAKTRGQ